MELFFFFQKISSDKTGSKTLIFKRSKHNLLKTCIIFSIELFDSILFRIVDKLLKEHNITLSDGSCPAVPDCSRIKQTYRTYDGSCNNLKNPKIGMKNTPYQRILKNAYSDRKCFNLHVLCILRRKTFTSNKRSTSYLSG